MSSSPIFFPLSLSSSPILSFLYLGFLLCLFYLPFIFAFLFAYLIFPLSLSSSSPILSLLYLCHLLRLFNLSFISAYLFFPLFLSSPILSISYSSTSSSFHLHNRPHLYVCNLDLSLPTPSSPVLISIFFPSSFTYLYPFISSFIRVLLFSPACSPSTSGPRVKRSALRKLLDEVE